MRIGPGRWRILTRRAQSRGRRRRTSGAVAGYAYRKARCAPCAAIWKSAGQGRCSLRFALYVDQPRQQAWQALTAQMAGQNASFEARLDQSAALHRALYESASFSLDGVCWENANETLTMQAFCEKQSPELIEKLWHFGRYLFICGSAPGANPFPLYGLWDGCYQPMWCHNMANENLQMIYWHCFTGNLLPMPRGGFSNI